MDKLIELIKNNAPALLVCPDDFKAKVLSYLNKNRMIIDVSYISLNDYKCNVTFDYDFKALKYLCDKEKLSISNAREILRNILYVDENIEYNNEKLDKLVYYKKLLKDGGLLLKNPLFKKQLMTKNVFVAGYGMLSDEDKTLISGKSVTYIEPKEKEKKYEVAEFNEIEEEVEYLYNSIFDLLSKGRKIDDIIVMNASNEYESYFKRFNSYYPFTINFRVKDYLIGTSKARELLDLIDVKDREAIYEYFNDDDNLSRQLIAVINKYASYNLKDVKKYIEDDLKNTAIRHNGFKNVVNCIRINEEVDRDDEVFLIGFNNNVPSFRQDTDYITDNLCGLVNKTDTQKTNELIRINTRIYLSDIENLHISYAKTSPFNQYEISSLFDEYEIVKIEKQYEYSESRNRNRYAYELDNLLKYNSREDDLGLYFYNYGKNDFGTFDNKFSGLRKEQLKKKVSLSYSSMNNYYQCAFKYYLNNYLGLTDFENNYNTVIGTLCHNVLQDRYELDKFDFEESWNRHLNQLIRDNPDVLCGGTIFFYIEKIKEEMIANLKILNRQREDTLLNKTKCENEFRVQLNDDILFKGFIDKLIYNDSGDRVVADIIDYKTGNSTKYREKLLEYGLSLQLPSYIYLLNNDNPFNKPVDIGGFYLQHIVNSNRKYTDGKTLDDLKNESMKLEGISSSDIARLGMCDSSLVEGKTSDNILSLKMNVDGSLAKNSKVISDAELDNMNKLVHTHVLSAGNAILKGEFKINPKIIDENNESCSYCPYRNICYLRNDDLNYISTKKEAE